LTIYPTYLFPEPTLAFAKEQSARNEVKAEVGAKATLRCEVAQEKTEVTWYKDGKKLISSSKVRLETSGCTRLLVVQQADKADAGEYSCETRGHKVFFHLDVTGQYHFPFVWSWLMTRTDPGAFFLSFNLCMSSASHCPSLSPWLGQVGLVDGCVHHGQSPS
jgi:hypothetical protein